MVFLLEVVAPVTDLTSLITTVASSTAALVAIIGGFLVSRVISLSSEHGGIKKRIDEVNVDILNKKDRLQIINDWLYNFDANDFANQETIKLIVDSKSLQEIIDERNFKRLSYEELQPIYNTMSNAFDEMYTYLFEGTKKDIFFSDLKFEDIKKDSHTMNFSQYENIYLMIFEELRYGSEPSINFKSDYDSYRTKKESKKNAELDLKVLEKHKESLLQMYYDYAKPKGVISGLFVLAYASLVSIVYPLTLLPYPTEYYNDNQTKWLVLGLFFSQLLFLFAYLFWQVHKLSSIKKTKIY